MGLAPLRVHLEMGVRGTKDTTSPHPQGLASPQGISASLSETRVRMAWSQPLPFPKPFPSHHSQLGSSCDKAAPSRTLSPSSWGPAALGSTPSSRKVLLCLSVLIWTPGVGSLSCHVLSTGRGPSPQEVSPSLPGYHHHSCLHSSKCAGVFLGNPSRGLLRQTPAHPKRKGAWEEARGSHSHQNIGPYNGAMYGCGGGTDHLRRLHPPSPQRAGGLGLAPEKTRVKTERKESEAPMSRAYGHSRSPDLSGSRA